MSPQQPPTSIHPAPPVVRNVKHAREYNKTNSFDVLNRKFDIFTIPEQVVAGGKCGSGEVGAGD